jgi:hypothetical protein
MDLLDNAKALLADLNAKVEAGDIEGGKAALSEMKVSLLLSIIHVYNFLFVCQCHQCVCDCI